ncbi:tRNA 2-thiouridine(34) synthase MnmA [Geobacter argillaceus]|nr:tRNA 2-thiouridine(34) synthase MnmA [Geobacter argillaceus]
MTQTSAPKKIVVAMSGGVDSSVTAALLKSQGHDVIGVTMQLWDKGRQEAAAEEEFRPCCTLEDAMDAARVAARLGIDFHVLDLEELFRSEVVDRFVAEYLHGLTPNPCIVCNERIKFGILLDKARELGADYLATGHYVRLECGDDGLMRLKKADDRKKDQSYFLYRLSQEVLQAAIFPLGTLTKPEVRKIADEYQLPVAKKAESQEICFVDNNDYVAFIEKRSETAHLSGTIVDRQGKVLGRHSGTHRYTIGQRRGLGIAAPRPLYVLATDPASGTVTVGFEEELYSDLLTAGSVNWQQPPPAAEFAATCKIRYRQEPVPCTVRVLDNDRVQVDFPEPVKSVTPGQSVVFYDNDTVLGGGLIESGTEN